MPKSQLNIIILAIVVLAVGYALYAGNAGQYSQCHSVIGGIVKALDVRSALQCGNVDRWHYISFGIMGLGGIMMVLGIIPGYLNRK